MEANSVNSIQHIINERARKRLIRDIEDLTNPIERAHHVLGDIIVEVVIPKDYEEENNKFGETKKIQLNRLLTYFREHIIEKKLEQYLKEETLMFVREVEELRERVNELENGVLNNGSNE